MTTSQLLKKITTKIRSYGWLGNYVGITIVFVALVAASFNTQSNPTDPQNKPRIIKTAATLPDVVPANTNSESIKPRFENWMLCRSDEAEMFFSVDKLGVGSGTVPLTYLQNQNLQETYPNNQVQEYVKSPSRFVLRLSHAADPSHTQVEIQTTKEDNDPLYQGKISINPLVKDRPEVKNSDITCTPLTRPAA